MTSKTFKAQQLDWRARLHFPKNNFFCYRWRVVDTFNRSIDREMFHMQLQGGNFHQALVNERVLALYKMSYRKTKNDFMSQITQSAVTFLESRRKALSEAVQKESCYTASMTEMVETIFNILLSCSIELNTVLGFSELFVAATEPEVVTYSASGHTKQTSLRARLSTSLFSLVIHGQKNQIAFYLLPVEDLIGLTHTANGREPMHLINATIEDEQVVWRIGGDIINDDDALEEHCMRVLHQLIQSTQDVLSQMAVA